MTRAVTRLATRLKRLAKSERGTVAPLIGLMFLVLIGCMGIALDTGRAMIVKARLVDALDAAGLAVGARMNTSDFKVDAKRFVDANFRAQYVGATVKDVTATPNSDKSVITLGATADMPTAFMRIFGQSMVTVKATTEVTRQTSGLELVLALDNTGSMLGAMQSLKDSAKLLLDILYGSKDTVDDLYVGLVPFSQTVTLGGAPPTYSAWMDADHAKTQVPASLAQYKSLWPNYSVGCVEARGGGLDPTDTVPVQSDKSTLFHYYFYPYEGTSQDDFDKWLNAGGPNRYCPKPVLPMTPTKSKIKTAIDQMTADGNTHVNLGAVWGWRMLSPNWRGLWGGDMASRGLPLNYNTKNMAKALVLLTDGANVMAGSTGDPKYTAYGKLAEKRLADTATAAAAELDARLTTVCNRMKTAGVKVYAIAFNNPPDTIKTLMQNCATQTDFYFPAGDETQLRTAFRVIGDSLSNLRVSR